MAVANKKRKGEKYQIQVLTRIRPFSERESQQKQRKCFEISEKHINVLLSHGSKRFVFDKIFDMDKTQNYIYKQAMSPIVADVLKGYNCTVFSYGQTGTGKTYTMTGLKVSSEADCESGFIARALEQIFDAVNGQSVDYTVRVSYVEIYNEVLNDLLSEDDKKILRIYEDRENKGCVQIHGVEEVQVLDKTKIYELLRIASQKRKIAATYLNHQASRSHSIFTVNVHIKETSAIGEELYKIGKLTLVDLAGSEYFQRTGSNENIQRSNETKGEANLSLLTFVRVMKALVERISHIPYKESKLTRILQDSLGGKTKTTIIATISPCVSHLEETLSTLEFASKARQIVTKPEINQSLSKKTVAKRYQEEIERLQKDLRASRNRTGFYLNNDNYDLILKETEENENKFFNAGAECLDFANRIEELERKRSELADVYSITQQELEGTKDSLEKFRHDLKWLRKDKHIRTALINKYEEAQSEHIKHSMTLSAALDDHIREHNILRSKVDSAYSAIDRNNSATDYLDKEHTNVSLHLSDVFNKLRKDTLCHLQKEQEARSDCIANQMVITEKMGDSSQNMRALCTELIDCFCEHLKVGDEALEARQMASLQLSEERANEFKKMFVEEYQLLSCAMNVTQSQFVENSHEHKESLKVQEELVKEQEKLIESKGQYWLKQVGTMIKNTEEQLLKVDDFINKSKGSMQAYKKQKNHLKKLLDATFKNTNLICAKQKELIDSVVGENDKFMGLIDTQTTICQKSLDNDLKEFSDKTVTLEKFVETRQAKRNDDIDHLITHLKEINKQFANGLLKAQELINKNSVEFKQCTVNEKLEQDAFMKTASDRKERIFVRNGEVFKEFAEQIDQSRATLNTYNTIMSNNDSHINTTIEERIEDCRKMCAAMSSVVNGFINQFEIFKPSGDTPGRKDCVSCPIPRKVSSKIIQNMNVADLALFDESLEEDGRISLGLCDSRDTEGEYRGQYVTTQFKTTSNDSI